MKATEANLKPESPAGFTPASGSANRSNDYARTQHNPREAAFAAAWEKENEPCNHINYGNGILQDLFCNGSRFGIQGVTASKVLTDDERMVTATAIQWLGSNCGWCFLEEVVNKCGYKLVRVDSPNESSSPATPGSAATSAEKGNEL